MQIGKLNQKANPILLFFALVSALIIIGLLYIMQKSVAAADNLSSTIIYQEEVN